MCFRVWAYSTANDGARNAPNWQFVDGLLRHGSLATMPGMTFAIDQTIEQGVPCFRLHFLLPRAYHSTGVGSVPVLLPTAGVGTNMVQPHHVFYTLLEETIGWLANVGPKNTLVRLHHNSHGQLARSDSLDWQQLHNGSMLFIGSLRQSHGRVPGLGQISGSFGVIEVAQQARTPSNHVSSDFAN
jgi:hypothetical protein